MSFERQGIIYDYAVETDCGEMDILWAGQEDSIAILMICLPGTLNRNKALLAGNNESQIVRKACRKAERLGEKLRGYMNGGAWEFNETPDYLQFKTEFQKHVLLTERKVPPGRIISYGTLAAWIEKPRAVRAVGRALAKNPYPIVIPCHRTVRADGSLGGFQGGVELKRKLLEREGVRFDECGRALREHFVEEIGLLDRISSAGGKNMNDC